MFFLSDRHAYKEVQNLTGETWMPIENYNYYLISNFGRVKVLGHTLVDKSGRTKNIPTRIMLGTVDSNTCKHTVNLNEKGVITTYNTDYLVLKTFSGIDKPFIVTHKDGDEMNCNYHNLEYSDMSSSNEIGKKEPKFKPVHVVDGLKIDMVEFLTARDAYVQKFSKRFAVMMYVSKKLCDARDMCAVLYILDVKKIVDTHRYDYICGVVDEIIKENNFK